MKSHRHGAIANEPILGQWPETAFLSFVFSNLLDEKQF